MSSLLNPHQPSVEDPKDLEDREGLLVTPVSRHTQLLSRSRHPELDGMMEPAFLLKGTTLADSAGEDLLLMYL